VSITKDHQSNVTDIPDFLNIMGLRPSIQFKPDSYYSPIYYPMYQLKKAAYLIACNMRYADNRKLEVKDCLQFIHLHFLINGENAPEFINNAQISAVKKTIRSEMSFDKGSEPLDINITAPEISNLDAYQQNMIDTLCHEYELFNISYLYEMYEPQCNIKKFQFLLSKTFGAKLPNKQEHARYAVTARWGKLIPVNEKQMTKLPKAIRYNAKVRGGLSIQTMRKYNLL
jgi:hypothetical protein